MCWCPASEIIVTVCSSGASSIVPRSPRSPCLTSTLQEKSTLPALPENLDSAAAQVEKTQHHQIKRHENGTSPDLSQTHSKRQKKVSRVKRWRQSVVPRSPLTVEMARGLFVVIFDPTQRHQIKRQKNGTASNLLQTQQRQNAGVRC
jgi:hypothetical protein